MSSKNITFLLFLSLIALLAVSSVYYQSERITIRQFDDNFTAIPPGGYDGYRALRSSDSSPTDAQTMSILRQGISYHQQGEFRYALSSFNAYLEGNDVKTDYRAPLLASTAAGASGEYQMGEEYLSLMPHSQEPAASLYHWYKGLYQLRKGEVSTAKNHFEKIASSSPAFSLAQKLQIKLQD